jgi:hypothetical protein
MFFPLCFAGYFNLFSGDIRFTVITQPSSSILGDNFSGILYFFHCCCCYFKLWSIVNTQHIWFIWHSVSCLYIYVDFFTKCWFVIVVKYFMSIIQMVWKLHIIGRDRGSNYHFSLKKIVKL